MSADRQRLSRSKSPSFKGEKRDIYSVVLRTDQVSCRGRLTWESVPSNRGRARTSGRYLPFFALQLERSAFGRGPDASAARRRQVVGIGFVQKPRFQARMGVAGQERVPHGPRRFQPARSSAHWPALLNGQTHGPFENHVPAINQPRPVRAAKVSKALSPCSATGGWPAWFGLFDS